MAAGGRPAGPDGLALVDKAAGWTSHDVVAKARGVLGTRKVGHSGTLDPDATGLLLLGVGKVTRLLQYLGLPSKTYVGVVVLGTSTATLDASGAVTGTWDMAGVGRAEVAAAAAALTGPILQVPPMVSAVQVGGRRLHELARQGIEIERAARPVTVHAFAVGSPIEPGCFPIEVICSSGTYIRSLAAEVGTALGGGAHLRDLRRTAIGSFSVDRAVAVEAITPEGLLSPAAALGDMAMVIVDDEVATAVGFGKVLPRQVLGLVGEGPWPIVGPAGNLLAVYEGYHEGLAKPSVVLAPAGQP
ncbi:MAG: tRNA pseudouridine(55) synthase TruB [Acidimicrobiia bacterium]|nr:tRNA pseudouridine(55) synthase TruB [Acidimicrobiia bacterium]